jgi:phytanoyl-CoA hydroxylase
MRLTDDERRRYDEDGYVVRERAFDEAELARLRAAAEELCQRLSAHAGAPKLRVSEHYVFEVDALDGVVIKWEPQADHVVQGVEPFAHLHHEFTAVATHPAFVEPCSDILGVDEVGLFTEKLNVKRADVGGRYALHQDYPYWRDAADEPERLVTAWVALDDATVENGALEVLPGSHRRGMVPGRESDRAFERNEIDEAAFDTSSMVPVEVAAGGIVFFGPYLVHRSAPNRSPHDRRALLYTYQRSGLRTQRDNVLALTSGATEAS